MNHRKFQIELARSLVIEAGLSHTTIVSQQSVSVPGDRLSGRHFPSKIPPRASGQQAQRQCVVCSFQREEN